MIGCRTTAATLGATVVGCAAALTYAVRVPSCSWLDGSKSRGTGSRRAVALTFDDGPSESTPAVLEVLALYRAPATFFQCGVNVRRLPDITRSIAAAGHEIGNHSDSHPLLSMKSRAFIYQELAAAQDSIEDAASIRPRYFRPPFGVRWFGLRGAQQRLGLSAITWSTIALDWKRNTPAVVSRVLQGASPGAIFCFHDGRILEERPDISVTIQALREILPRLIDRGFHFEKVTDILCPTKS